MHGFKINGRNVSAGDVAAVLSIAVQSALEQVMQNIVDSKNGKTSIQVESKEQGVKELSDAVRNIGGKMTATPVVLDVTNKLDYGSSILAQLPKE